MQGLSLVAASGGHSSSWGTGLSLSRPLLLRSTGSTHTSSVVVAHGPSCSAACGMFPDQGSNPCPLHWQADSQPLRRQGSPSYTSFIKLPSSHLEQAGDRRPEARPQLPGCRWHKPVAGVNGPCSGTSGASWNIDSAGCAQNRLALDSSHCGLAVKK